jgi:hypothetical protein
MNQLSDATQSPAWPGIRVLENTCDLFLKVKEWGEPVCPLFLRGSDYADAPNIPPQDELRFHVATLMWSAKRPPSARSRRPCRNNGRRRWRTLRSWRRSLPSRGQRPPATLQRKVITPNKYINLIRDIISNLSHSF